MHQTRQSLFNRSGLEAQRGVSVPLVLIILVMASILLTIGFKLYPVYFENWQIDAVVNSFENEAGLRNKSENEIRKNFQARLSTNNVRSFDFEDSVYIEKTDEQLYIDVDYEVRVDIFDNIDAVVSFRKTLEKNL